MSTERSAMEHTELRHELGRREVTQKRPFWTPHRQEALVGWLFVLPWLIGFIVFTAGPMLFSVYASFTRYNILGSPQWLGLANYQTILRDPFFYKSLENTFWMVLIKTPIVIIVSIAIAVLLNMELPGAKAARTIIYLPNVLAGVAAIFLWQWILAPNGLFNRFLGNLGINGPAWFSDPGWTKPGLVIMGMWWIGGNVIVYLANLKGIPKELYEAAAIDGANDLQQAFRITLPLLTPAIFFQIVTSIIGTFQMFDSAYIISGTASNVGGPGQSMLFYVLYLYNRAFGRIGPAGFQMGYASALAWILFLIILAVTLIQLWFANRWVYYETSS